MPALRWTGCLLLALFASAQGPPLAIQTPATLPNGAIGQSYLELILVTGGRTPYDFRVVDGSLPPGLRLSADRGEIAGVPTAAGSYAFTVEVNDAGRQAAVRRTFSVTVTALPTQTLATGTVGIAYAADLTVEGGTQPFFYSILNGNLPAGLTLSSTTGQVRGTPTEAGLFTFIAQVVDANGFRSTRQYSIRITPALSLTTASPLPSAVLGASYSQSLQATGGTPPYRFSLVGGQLPEGLTLNAAGILSGTPRQAGTARFTLRVTDTANLSATRDYTLTVSAGLDLTTAPTLPAAVAGTAYSARLDATGGTPPYRFAVVSGALPAGLSLSSDGALTGTPTAAGSVTFTVQVTDAVQATARRAFTLTVSAPALSVLTATLPDAVVGTPYSQTLSATGGTGPYRFTVASGTPPPGLTLSSTGQVTGTPTAAGSFSVTVRVTDAAQATATRALTLVVALPTLPLVTLTGLSDRLDPARQAPLGVTLAQPYPVALTGQLTLSFTSSAEVPADDPSVQFSSGGRTATFTLPAGATEAVFPSPLLLQTGTVAGSITLTARLRSGTQDLTTASPPTRTAQVPSLAPVLEAVRAARTETGFLLTITGFSTPRGITQAVFRLTGSATGNLQTTEVVVPLDAAFASWYASAEAAQFGSLFSYRQAFRVQGDPAAITGVSTILRNRQGESSPVTVTLP